MRYPLRLEAAHRDCVRRRCPSRSEPGPSRATATCFRIPDVPAPQFLSICCFQPKKERLHMNMRPLRDRILVERIEEAEQRIGDIIIPDSAREKPQSGRVIAVGKGRVDDKGDVCPLDVKEGETVLFGKYGGSEVNINGKEYLILREDDVLGVLEESRQRELATV